MNIRRAALITLRVAGTFGCGGRKVLITASITGEQRIPSPSSSGAAVYVGGFKDVKDTRPEGRDVGQSLGSWGRRDRYVVDDIAGLVQSAVAAGITAQGHSVTTRLDEARFVVSGQVLRFSVDMLPGPPLILGPPLMEWKAQVQTTIEVRRRDGSLVVQRAVVEDASAKAALSAPNGRERAGKTLSEALQRVAGAVAEDRVLDAALRTLPPPAGR
jgi:hypothetical protein